MGFVWEILYGELELQGRQEMVVEQLKKAGQIKDSLLLSFKADFTAIFRLECVQSGALDDLPLSVANGDMNPTNLMVIEQGVLSGLVDWGLMRIWPLGFDLGAIHGSRVQNVQVLGRDTLYLKILTRSIMGGFHINRPITLRATL